MHAFTGPKTKTGREYKFEQVQRVLVRVGAESVELEHSKLEMEIDSAHLVDVKFRGYKLEAMGPALVPKSLLVASWSGKLTRS